MNWNIANHEPHTYDDQERDRRPSMVLPTPHSSTTPQANAVGAKSPQQQGNTHDTNGVIVHGRTDVAVQERVDGAQRSAARTVDAKQGFGRAQRRRSAGRRRVREPDPDAPESDATYHHRWARDPMVGHLAERAENPIGQACRSGLRWFYLSQNCLSTTSCRCTTACNCDQPSPQHRR